MPLPERDSAYLLDILLAARLATSYVAGKSWTEFHADYQCQDAVIRRLEIIGEAARRVSDPAKAALPTLPWHQMMGLRNRVIHEYDRVDLQIVWHTVLHDLPALIETIERLIGPADSPE
jgi:uncharacterized protein with HEPN domain